MIAEGVETVLHSFGQNDGGQPQAPLMTDNAGNLYGTTFSTAFELTVSGGNWTETVLHTFSGRDGSGLMGGLLRDTSTGNLYGTASGGGEYDGGTIFQLTPGAGAWTETVLHSFAGVNGDGAYPKSNLVFDFSGGLCGTASVGGINGGQCGGLGCGIAFDLEPSTHGQWKERVLHRFTGGADGGQPYGGLVRDNSGNSYGTTSRGGTGDQGIVFEITP